MTNPMQLMNIVTQLKSNPMQALMSMKMNVPQSMMNDPNQIIQHLLSTNQVSQDTVNRAYQMAGQFRR